MTHRDVGILLNKINQTKDNKLYFFFVLFSFVMKDLTSFKLPEKRNYYFNKLKILFFSVLEEHLVLIPRELEVEPVEIYNCNVYSQG